MTTKFVPHKTSTLRVIWCGITSKEAISKNYNYVHNLIFISCCFTTMQTMMMTTTTTSVLAKEWACLCGLEWPFFSAQDTPHEYEKWIPSTSTFYLQTCKWVSGSFTLHPHIYFWLCFCVNFPLNCSHHLPRTERIKLWTTQDKRQMMERHHFEFMRFKCTMCVFVSLKQTRYN